jgi:hypothetical protein
MYDHYTIELRKGPVGAMETLRSSEAKNVEDAQTLIEGWRSSCVQRDGVTWQTDEVDAKGDMYGMAGQTVWHIACVPPLTEKLTGE